MTPITEKNLDDWAKRHGFEPMIRNDHRLTEHYPTETVRKGRFTCEPGQASPVLSFEDDDWYYLVQGTDSYALVKRPLGQNTNDEPLGFLAGLIAAFLWMVLTPELEVEIISPTSYVFLTIVLCHAFLGLGWGVDVIRWHRSTEVGESELVAVFENERAVLDDDRIAERLYGPSGSSEGTLIHSNAQALLDEAEDRATTIA